MKAIARLVVAAALCIPATAQAAMLVRVSGKGADAAGCGSVTAPCRTLQFAHDQVDAGGYIVAVDPADFGPIIIAKSITITNQSNGAALLRADATVSSGAAVDIVGATLVRLHGLTLEAPHIGVLSRSALSRIEIEDCEISLNGASAVFGVNILPRSAPNILLSNVTIKNAGAGLWLSSRAVYARGLRLINNPGGGILTFTPDVVTLVLESSLIANDPGQTAAGRAGIGAHDTLGVARNTIIRGFPIGLDATSSLFQLSKSAITDNEMALRKSQSMIQSAGDNIIRGNVDDALGALTPAALH